TVTELRYKSKRFGTEIRAASTFTSPVQVETAPPTYDPSIAKGQDVRLLARVGKDGHVLSVEGPASPAADSARKALAGWVFTPAMENGEPQEAFEEAVFRFDEPVAHRGLFRGSEAIL